MDKQIEEMRAKICYFGAMLFDRHLTDSCGGNISARVGDLICISARYSGQRHQWQLKPENVLVVDKTGSILDGKGDLSRESKVHLTLYSEFGDAGTAVIHAHARNVLVFAALARPMPPVLEANLKFGEVPVIEYEPAHSAKLAENVVNALRGNQDRIRKHAAGVIAPWHGIFLMGKDLDCAFDAVERFDTNAYCIIMGQMLASPEVLAKQQAALAAQAAAKK